MAKVWGKDFLVEGTSPVGGVAQGKAELEVVGGSEGVGAVGAIGKAKIVSERGFALKEKVMRSWSHSMV